MYPLNHIQTRLADHRHSSVPMGPATRQAAVAIILRERTLRGGGVDTEILFIRRAEKDGDPWSGHMAFPGGHREATDADLKAAAERETREEIGFDLSGAPYLGELDHQHAAPRGRQLDMLIAPHVFALQADHRPRLNHEVAEVVWTPLAPLIRGEHHSWETFAIAGSPMVFNGYRLPGGHFVWGLTYRMLKTFFGVLDPDWQPPAER